MTTPPAKAGGFSGVGNYYNGGAGTDYGVSYSSNAKALTQGISNEPSAPDVIAWSSGTTMTVDVANGFDTSVSFYYAASKAFTVAVYDGVDGTGNLLASQSEAVTPTPYTVWDDVTVGFSGIAESVVFTGSAGYCALDNITLANLEPASVPESSSIAMTALGAILGVGPGIVGAASPPPPDLARISHEIQFSSRRDDGAGPSEEGSPVRPCTVLGGREKWGEFSEL